MKIAIYARVSSETQAKEGTIDSQIEALHDYAKTHDLTIVREFIDDGYSGAELNRPGLDQLRDSIQGREFEAILVFSPDRLSRKQAHQIILLEEFKKRNVQVLFTTQSFSDSPEDQLMLQIQGAISEYERAIILDRMRRGRKHSVIRGQVIGSIAPFGYTFITKSEKAPAHWEVNQEEAEIVRLIFDLYVHKGLKGTAIARRLQQDDIATRGVNNRWYSSTIYSILKNEAYAGTAYMFKCKAVEPTKNLKVNKYRRYKNSRKEPRPREEWIGIPVTPILDLKLWQDAQKLLKQNANKSRRNNNKNHYLLRGLVQCGLCGSIASGHVSNKNTYYSCGARRNGNITTKPHAENVAIKHSLLDKRVWSGMVELLDDPNNLMSQLEKRLVARRKAYSTVRNSSPVPTASQLSKLDIQEQRLIDAYREGAINLPELKEQKGKLAARRNVLEEKKKAALSQLESSGQPEISLSMLGDVSARYRRVMTKADFATKEKLANLLINSVTLYPDKAVVEGNIPVIQSDALIPSSFRLGFEDGRTHMS